MGNELVWLLANHNDTMASRFTSRQYSWVLAGALQRFPVPEMGLGMRPGGKGSKSWNPRFYSHQVRQLRPTTIQASSYLIIRPDA